MLRERRRTLSLTGIITVDYRTTTVKEVVCDQLKLEINAAVADIDDCHEYTKTGCTDGVSGHLIIIIVIIITRD